MQALISTLVTLKEDSKLYEVRIFGKDGVLVRSISPQSLTKRYWEKFEEERLQISLKKEGV